MDNDYDALCELLGEEQMIEALAGEAFSDQADEADYSEDDYDDLSWDIELPLGQEADRSDDEDREDRGRLAA